MNEFMNDNFLLSNEVAVNLYHNYAKNLPIIDYHSHIIPKEIAEDISFDNITSLWLGADHYKWRYMRACGIDEHFITGDASDREKFDAWIDCLESAIGNPLYHWSHLELKKYFGIEGYVTSSRKDEIWNKCNEVLHSGSMSSKQIIDKSNVEILCTTDDPVDSLEYHEKIAEGTSLKAKVLPAFRPDNAMNPDNPSFCEYIEKLEKASNIKIESYSSLIEALKSRIAFFNEHGCKIADHGFDTLRFIPASDEEVNNIFKKRIAGHTLSAEEIHKFRTAFLLSLGEEYNRLNWVSQLHFGVKRENNETLYKKLGPNSGIDCINNTFSASDLADFLNKSLMNNALPKTIIYSLNPNDNALIDTVISCFQGEGIRCKIQHGSAWWFNDNKLGMEAHLETLASLSNLSGFVGMLTDSRSFVSYTRHEYFRRILCNYLGTLVQKGEFPEDYDILGKTVTSISYENAKSYFGLS